MSKLIDFYKTPKYNLEKPKTIFTKPSTPNSQQ